MSSNNTIDRLGDNQLFKGLSPDAIERLCALGDVISVAKEEVIVNEGQINDHLYLICSGVCEVSLGNAQEHLESMRIATHGPHAFFGEYSFLDRNIASANVRAVTDAELFRIPFDKLDELLEEDLSIRSGIYRNMLDIMVSRLRENVAELSLFDGAPDVDEPELTQGPDNG